ncbi:hypothetical protein HQ36_03900 [Porphyromonas gingivicanis]|uniref:Uncharacterized protein n=1 Tax=Porphyromonas gingivicanis TaxID=266762 RepID=A0A0A2G456_9PORP|nr:hypothetical protein HQ36_03900 [Porphyromonas gingivicanis]
MLSFEYLCSRILDFSQRDKESKERAVALSSVNKGIIMLTFTPPLWYKIVPTLYLGCCIIGYLLCRY